MNVNYLTKTPSGLSSDYHYFIYSAYTTRMLQPIRVDDTQNTQKFVWVNVHKS